MPNFCHIKQLRNPKPFGHFALGDILDAEDSILYFECLVFVA